MLRIPSLFSNSKYRVRKSVNVTTPTVVSFASSIATCTRPNLISKASFPPNRHWNFKSIKRPRLGSVTQEKIHIKRFLPMFVRISDLDFRARLSSTKNLVVDLLLGTKFFGKFIWWIFPLGEGFSHRTCTCYNSFHIFKAGFPICRHHLHRQGPDANGRGRLKICMSSGPLNYNTAWRAFLISSKHWSIWNHTNQNPTSPR